MLASSMAPLSAIASENRRKLGFALVGLGSYATGQLGPSLKETRNCYLAGIVTGTPAKAERWAREYDIQQRNIYNYENFDAIVDNDAIDVVYVVLPNSMHAEFSIRALQAGKHVICEKPMGLTEVECEQMIAVAEENRRLLAVGYRMPYDPYFIEMKRLAQSGEMGQVNYMESALGYSYTPQLGSWKLKKSMGGGSLYNLGVYPIQNVRHAKGSEPIAVTAQASTKRPEYFSEFPEMYTWQLEWADGTLASCYTGPNARIDRLFVGCRDGWINFEPATAYSGQACRTSRGDFNFPQVNQQRLQMEDFARCVIEGTPSKVGAHEGLQDARIIDAIHESIRTGRKVMLG